MSSFTSVLSGRADLSLLRLPASSSSPTAVVYFQITSLELSPAPAPSRILGGTAEEALTDQLDAGELGCFVDPYATKLLQTGIERSLVPDMSGFLGISEQRFALSPLFADVSSSQPTSRPSVRSSTFSAMRLQDLDCLSMCKLPCAQEPATTIFTSPCSSKEHEVRASGQSSRPSLARPASICSRWAGVTRQRATHADLSNLQLDCFELLGETDLKTEGHLRARIEKAVSCSPCMLFLRNIEALARKSQALETGQGELPRSRRGAQLT